MAAVACAVFGSICGSGAATLSCIGSILAPKMRERKYPMGVCAAVLACAAPIGMLIPPSSIQILFAWAGNLSVLTCFLATVVPGIILTILISIVGIVMCQKYPDVVVSERLPKKIWLRRTGKSTLGAIPALIMPVIVLGGIYGGYMTASEAAGVAIVYAIPVSIFIYKGLKMKELGHTFREAATTTGVIMVMLGTIMVVSRILVMNNVPMKILDGLMMISGNNKYIILLMINIFMVIIGMLMDDVSGTLLLAPHPAAHRHRPGAEPLPCGGHPGRQPGHGECDASYGALPVPGRTDLQGGHQGHDEAHAAHPALRLSADSDPDDLCPRHLPLAAQTDYGRGLMERKRYTISRKRPANLPGVSAAGRIPIL